MERNPPMTLTPHMPDGKPAPYVLTATDAATFLRIKAKDANSALRTLRKKGLKAVMLSGRILFPLDEVVAFIKREVETNPR